MPAHDTPVPPADPLAAHLRDCGVTPGTLPEAARRALDTDGYLVLPEAVDTASLETWRRAFETLWDLEAATAPAAPPHGTRHVDLLADPAGFGNAVRHPGLLAAVHRCIGRPCRLTTLAGRDPRPGFGAQGLHQDWMRRHRGEPAAAVTALWLLDPFTATNGATRVVPGSHVHPGPPPRTLRNPDDHHPDERQVVAAAGALVVFNGHLWHSGTRNVSDASRRVLTLTFVAAELVRPGTAPRLPASWPPAIRRLLGGAPPVPPAGGKS